MGGIPIPIGGMLMWPIPPIPVRRGCHVVLAMLCVMLSLSGMILSLCVVTLYCNVCCCRDSVYCFHDSV
jgi:hypothetical protein